MNEIPVKTCVICMNDINSDEICITNCNHDYCNDCLLSWLNRGKTTCPTCRGEVINFTVKNELNHIIKINTNTTNDINEISLRNTIGRLYHQNIYLRFIIGIQFIYSLYSIYETCYVPDDYQALYHNCTVENEQLKEQIETLNGISHNKKLSELMLQYSWSYISQCYLPIQYINHCINIIV